MVCVFSWKLKKYSGHQNSQIISYPQVSEACVGILEKGPPSNVLSRGEDSYCSFEVESKNMMESYRFWRVIPCMITNSLIAYH